MKAIVYTAHATLQMADVPLPEPGQGDVLIKVVSAGICGSELGALQEQTEYRKPPLIMGHEFAGTRVDTGDRVTVNPLLTCGRCAFCRRGESQLCPTRTLVGVHRPGAFAEYVTAPISSVVRMPSGMSWAQAALAEPMATVIRFMRGLDLNRVASMGIIGTGGIGMLAVLAGRAAGMRHIAVAELSEPRRELARAYGADVVGAKLQDKFDVTVDAVGTEGTRNASLGCLERGGTAVWVGLHDDGCAVEGVRDLIRRECRIVTSFAYTMLDFHEAVRLLGTLNIARLVEEVPFASGLAAFDQLLAGTVAAPKIQLVM